MSSSSTEPVTWWLNITPAICDNCGDKNVSYPDGTTNQVRKGLVELLRALLERASVNLLYLTATFLKKLSVSCDRRR